jgi:uncharacterized membrane protein YfcA
MVGAGFWGGFIQIGVGFILMPILHRVLGLDLIRLNLYKVMNVLVYTIVALFIFAANLPEWHNTCLLDPGLYHPISLVLDQDEKTPLHCQEMVQYSDQNL